MTLISSKPVVSPMPWQARTKVNGEYTKKNQIEEVSKNIAPTHPELTKLYTPFSPIVIRSFACLF